MSDDKVTAERFLRQYMSLRDNLTLQDDFLSKNIDSALTARATSKWESIPDNIFLNYVLPYSRWV